MFLLRYCRYMYTHTAIFILLAVLQTGPHNSAFKFIFQQAGRLSRPASAFKNIFRLAEAFGFIVFVLMNVYFILHPSDAGSASILRSPESSRESFYSSYPSYLPPLSTEIVQVKIGSFADAKLNVQAFSEVCSFPICLPTNIHGRIFSSKSFLLAFSFALFPLFVLYQQSTGPPSLRPARRIH